MNLQSIIPKKSDRRRVKGLLCLALLLVLAMQMSPAGHCAEGLLTQHRGKQAMILAAMIVFYVVMTLVAYQYRSGAKSAWIETRPGIWVL